MRRRDGCSSWSTCRPMRRGCRRSFPADSSNAWGSAGRRRRMRTELKRLQRELGISFIHVTNSQDEAMALADIVVLMNAGQIEQQASPREIFNHPRTEFTAT